ncbi:MAG: N-acetylmuramoyl-L-alanine amidase [Phycisphaerales bacterium]|nr:N-acetylmuramoyl-L-alanine amidase [Phycisphaerales bacterium]
MQRRWFGMAVVAGSLFAVTGCAHDRIPNVQITPRSEWAKAEPVAERLHTHTPKYLTVHHAGVKDDGLVPGDEQMRRLYTFSVNEKPWGDVPYHYVIDRRGKVFEGRLTKFAPDTNTGYDVNGHICVCVKGDLTTQPLLEAQYRSLVDLLVKLAAEYDIPDSRVAGHMDYSPGKTDCPGVLEQYIKDGTLLRDMAAVRGGHTFTFEAKTMP